MRVLAPARQGAQVGRFKGTPVVVRTAHRLRGYREGIP